MVFGNALKAVISAKFRVAFKDNVFSAKEELPALDPKTEGMAAKKKAVIERAESSGNAVKDCGGYRIDDEEKWQRDKEGNSAQHFS